MRKLSIPRTRSDLRTAVETLPADTMLQMILGLDGDCDFSRQVTEFVPYSCSRDDLLALIDAEPSEELLPLPYDPEFLVLCRRHAVCLTGVLDVNLGAQAV